MKYYVVKGGRALSATQHKGEWNVFFTPTRSYASPLLRKHAMAFSHKAKGSEMINEFEFRKYKLIGDPMQPEEAAFAGTRS